MTKTATKSPSKAASSGSKPKSEKPAPAAARAPLVPHLTCRGAADAIAFYKKAFDAKELMRLPGPDGKLVHGAIVVNGSTVMLTDEWPDHGALSPLSLKGTPVTLHLNVDDVDAWFERAVKAGATVRMAVADMFWGDRYGIVTDPFGHSWSIATHKHDVTPAELEAAMKAGGGSAGRSDGDKG